MTVISVVLMAADFEKIREKAREWSFYDAAASVIRGILHSVGGYLRAQGIIMGLVMLLCTAGIWISGAASNPVAAGIGTGLLDIASCFRDGNRVSAVDFDSCIISKELYGGPDSGADVRSLRFDERVSGTEADRRKAGTFSGRGSGKRICRSKALWIRGNYSGSCLRSPDSGALETGRSKKEQKICEG